MAKRMTNEYDEILNLFRMLKFTTAFAIIENPDGEGVICTAAGEEEDVNKVIVTWMFAKLTRDHELRANLKELIDLIDAAIECKADTSDDDDDDVERYGAIEELINETNKILN